MSQVTDNMIRHFQSAFANQMSRGINYVIELNSPLTQEAIDSLNSCLLPMVDTTLRHAKEAETELELLNAVSDYCQDMEDEIPSALTRDDSVDAELAALRASFSKVQ